MQHIYRAAMPMGSEQRLVHLRADHENTPVKFVAIKRSRQGFTLCLQDECKWGKRSFITALSLDEETVAGHLAFLNNCTVDEIEIRPWKDVERNPPSRRPRYHVRDLMDDIPPAGYWDQR